MVKLYVGNLPFSIDERGLQEIFEQAGEVKEVKIVTDSFDGRSRGFGFVEMNTEDGASAAVEKLNGFDLNGRSLRVDRAKNQSSDRNNKNHKLTGAPRPGGTYRQW